MQYFNRCRLTGILVLFTACLIVFHGLPRSIPNSYMNPSHKTWLDMIVLCSSSIHSLILSLPLRYAQCWVLAGVAVTLMRALGIAARPVTCYNMASCFGNTLARYFTSEGDFVHGITSDIVWLGVVTTVYNC